jgi:hypothetical protein
MPLCVVSNGHGACLDDQVNGFWPFFHRLLAEAFALVPMSLWPWLLPISGALLTGGVAVVVFHVVSRLVGAFTGGVASAATVLLPFLGMEYINVVGNIHWLLLIIGMLTILSVGRDDDLNRFHAGVLFLVG